MVNADRQNPSKYFYVMMYSDGRYEVKMYLLKKIH